MPDINQQVWVNATRGVCERFTDPFWADASYLEGSDPAYRVTQMFKLTTDHFMFIRKIHSRIKSAQQLQGF